MKKTAIFILALSALFACMVSLADEDEKTIDIAKLPMGTTFVDAQTIIKDEGVKLIAIREDHPYIFVPVTAFGIETYWGADVLFDDHDKIEVIECDVWFDNMRQAYDLISAELGGADIVYISDYLDVETNDTYSDCGYQTYIVWVEEDAVYQLEMYSSFNIDVTQSFFEGINLQVNDTPSQHFELRVYSPKLFDEFSHLYE